MTETTHDGADDGFHEIQLSGKQLVFLFMATTVVSVVIFLCGVLVGRDVQTGAAPVATDAALTTPSRATPAAAEQGSPQPGVASAAAVAEPPSPPAGDELTYRKRLESEGSAADERLKAGGGTARADVTPEPARPEPAKPGAAKPAVVKAAAAAVKGSPAVAAPGARPGRWVLQILALRDRNAATSIVTRLSAKGYPAFIVNPSASGSGQVYRVQVGRYDDRSEAERVSRRLEKEEKFNPWISR